MEVSEDGKPQQKQPEYYSFGTAPAPDRGMGAMWQEHRENYWESRNTKCRKGQGYELEKKHWCRFKTWKSYSLKEAKNRNRFFSYLGAIVNQRFGIVTD